MRSLVFERNTWTEYENLIEQNKKLHAALRRQIKEMLRGDPAVGLGKPEKLRHQVSDLWSRRLSLKDRLIYRFDDRYVYLIAIGGHYDQLKRNGAG